VRERIVIRENRSVFTVLLTVCLKKKHRRSSNQGEDRDRDTGIISISSKRRGATIGSCKSTNEMTSSTIPVIDINGARGCVCGHAFFTSTLSLFLSTFI
jgi:hypothetical protein